MENRNTHADDVLQNVIRQALSLDDESLDIFITWLKAAVANDEYKTKLIEDIIGFRR